MSSSLGLPTRYLHSLMACPNCSSAELGPGTPFLLGQAHGHVLQGHQHMQGHSPLGPMPVFLHAGPAWWADLFLPLTTQCWVLLTSHHFFPPHMLSYISPPPKFGSETAGSCSLGGHYRHPLCPVSAGPHTVWTDSLCGAARPTACSAVAAHASQGEG